jgi:hypothetical protein
MIKTEGNLEINDFTNYDKSQQLMQIDRQIKLCNVAKQTLFGGLSLQYSYFS